MTDTTDNQQLAAETSFIEKVFEITAQFINLPTDQIDAAIEYAQQRICALCDLDRSAIFQWSPAEPDVLEMTHLYQNEHSPITLENVPDRKRLTDPQWVFKQTEPPPIYLRINALNFFPWVAGKIRNDETVAISRVEDLPDEAGHDREMMLRYATRSTLIIPLNVGGKQIGAITFASIRHETFWSENLKRNLQRIALAFAGAIERKRSDEALRASEARLLQAAEFAEADLWSLSLETWRLWVPDNVRNKYGLAPEEIFTLAKFLEFIHPEDHALIDKLVQEPAQSKLLTSVEYRITPANGIMHWVVSRGKVSLDDDGRPTRLTGVTIDITERKQLEEQLREQNREIKDLTQKLEQENLSLIDELKSILQHDDIIGQSMPIREVLALVEQVAPTASTVLVCGETGTGKELIAQAIHNNSPRRHKLMVKVNCASLPSSLVESELFGREKGAYTGALTQQMGRFELADRSTLFLDEIAELSLELQAKLLRVLQSGEFERLGSPKTIKVDVRIVAATNRNLLEEVRQGKFREDLYYRLNVFPICLPPLRERLEDIPMLVWEFVREFCEKMGKRINRISKKDMTALKAHSWPGNIRELRNVIEYAAIISSGDELHVRLPEHNVHGASPKLTLDEVEACHMENILRQTGWRIKGENGAARILGMNPATLYSRMKKHGIKVQREGGRIMG